MDGFELLAWVSRHLPQLPVIVMTAFGTPEIESRLAKFETIQYLEKPLDLETLENAILTGFNRRTNSYIHGITPAAFLQLLHLEKKSCSLKVSSSGCKGYLYLSQGNLIDAECGDLKGEAAAYQIVCWERTEIEMDNHCQRREGPIKSSVESILLNAYRVKDERGQVEADGADVLGQEFDLPDLTEMYPPAEQEIFEAQPILSKKVRDRLVELLSSNGSITEFGLFDEDSFLERQSSGNCSLHAFDPAIYLHLVGSLTEKLGMGATRWISFFTTRRIPFLLFLLPGYSLLVKLRQGARSQIIALELGKLLDNIVATG